MSTATYCVKTQCISIVEIYKGGGVNAVSYIRIYEKRIFFRFQLEMNNYISFLTPFGEMDETEDIHISEKLFNNKIVVKAISPIKTNGSVENIKLELDNYNLDDSDISLHDLIYKHKRVKYSIIY